MALMTITINQEVPLTPPLIDRSKLGLNLNAQGNNLFTFETFVPPGQSESVISNFEATDEGHDLAFLRVIYNGSGNGPARLSFSTNTDNQTFWEWEVRLQMVLDLLLIMLLLIELFQQEIIYIL